MPSPRLFVSSTCYDLKEIRNQLRKFIDDFGFEPVMSDYGDIFYNYEKHIQDSCKDEIEKCQLFILIIGNNYGSLYYNQSNDLEVPDSVTLQEFKKAIDTNIFKHIFINKYVEYDYNNYKKLKNKFLQANFDKNPALSEEDAKSQAHEQELEFNTTFQFAEESYRFIFPFLDIIFSLKTGNSVFSFESFDEIKNSLKKQWSALMYETLIKKNTVPVQLINNVNDKLDRIESQLRGLFESKIEDSGVGVLSLDLTSISNSLKINDLEDLKSQIYNHLNAVLYTDQNDPRFVFRAKVNMLKLDKILKKFEDVVNKNKWSQTINLLDIFNNLVVIAYWENRITIKYKIALNFIITLKSIESKIEKEEYELLKSAILQEMNNRYEEAPPIDDDDDLPF